MKDREFLQWAVDGAKIFARCSKRQYLAIVVAENGRVAGTGFNGAPAGMKNCTDGGCPRAIEGSASGSNYDNCVAIHAEENALLFSDAGARAGGTIYVNGPPCFGCAKKIANSGIRRIVYIPDESYKDWPRIRTFLSSAGIKTVPIVLEPEVKLPPETIKVKEPEWVYRTTISEGREFHWRSGDREHWSLIDVIPENGRIVQRDVA